MTSLETLKAAHCEAARLVILASGNDAFNLEAGFKALQLNPDAHIWIRLYRSGLASVMDLRTKPNVHFFSPYERAAEAVLERVAQHTEGDSAEA
jgi:voltage-gated potassium channel Kch